MAVKEYSIHELTEILKGELIRGTTNQTKIRDILIDSRRLISASRCVFFALVSKRNNGHKYIDELYSRGIRHFIVVALPKDINKYEKANFILVNNTLEALQSLCVVHRSKFDIPVIGITGSNGKTIVKEWLFQLMSDDKNVIRSPKSYNSQIGVPLSVWQMDSQHELGIFEAGISEPDEMDKLQKIIQPEIGIFTNIGNAHDENFINHQQKAGEKLKLFTKVKTLIYCADHPEIQGVIIRSGIFERVQPFTWSLKQDANLRIADIDREGTQTVIKASFLNESIEITIPFMDEASIENAIHCWATLLHLGYDQELIAARMLRLNPIAMRLELKEGINNCSIINDSYNSDINSLSIALDFLAQQKQHRQKTIILSDILQSGQNEVDLYSEIAQLLESKGIQKIIGIGNSIAEHADRFSMEKHFFVSTEEFLNKFSFASFSNESILLKGARVFEFEQISKALQQKAHETVLEVNLNSLVNNLNYYKSGLKDPKTKIMAMVKAFSYGSGSFEIANVLQFHNIDYLAVAYADEGVELRKAGIHLPMMVMNPDEQSFDSIIKHNLEPEIYSFRILELLEKAIKKNIIPSNKPVKIHLKLDTGMHRLGFLESEIDELISRLKNHSLIYLQSVFSHLAASGNSEHDEFTNHQISLFKRMSESIIAHADDHPILLHILNSAGINRFPDAQFDMVRLGISMYGIASNQEESEILENVTRLRSTISQIKKLSPEATIGYDRTGSLNTESRIAIVPIGYADGLNRALGNGNGHLIVNGQNAPTVGSICMDMCMIDITNIQAKEGDEVIIFGPEQSISELAKDMNTIPYEILSGISRRVKRVYYQE